MTAIVTDAGRGITDRFRSLPMAGSAVVAGRGVADLLNAAVGLVVLMACGWAIGWGWHDGPPNALAAVALLLWLRFAMIWLGLYLGLVAGKPEAVVAVQILVWPLGFLSNAFSDPATMPGWLGTIAEWNPLSAHGRRDARAVRQPRLGRRLRGRRRTRCELAVVWPLVLTRDLLPAGGRALSGAGPVSPGGGPDRSRHGSVHPIRAAGPALRRAVRGARRRRARVRAPAHRSRRGRGRARRDVPRRLAAARATSRATRSPGCTRWRGQRAPQPRRSGRRQAALRGPPRRRAHRPRPADATPPTRGCARRSPAEPIDREALLLTAWEGLSPERAARAAGCSRATFHVRLHRARKRLAHALEEAA